MASALSSENSATHAATCAPHGRLAIVKAGKNTPVGCFYQAELAGAHTAANARGVLFFVSGPHLTNLCGQLQQSEAAPKALLHTLSQRFSPYSLPALCAIAGVGGCVDVGVPLIFALKMRDDLEQAAEQVLQEMEACCEGPAASHPGACGFKVAGVICTITAHPLTDASGGGRPTLGPTPGSSQRLATASG